MLAAHERIKLFGVHIIGLISMKKNRLMKIITGILLVSILIMYSNCVDSEIADLSREYLGGQKKITDRNYDFRIVQNDDKYYHRMDFTVSSYFAIETASGDSMVTIPSIGCGYFGDYSVQETFSDYDSGIIRFNEREVVPQKVGKTSLIVQYPVGQDTFEVRVKEVTLGKLQLEWIKLDSLNSK